MEELRIALEDASAVSVRLAEDVHTEWRVLEELHMMSDENEARHRGLDKVGNLLNTIMQKIPEQKAIYEAIDGQTKKFNALAMREVQSIHRFPVEIADSWVDDSGPGPVLVVEVKRL